MSNSTLPLPALPPRESAVGACARALREAILSGRLARGSSLPPERDLAAQLGVNRLTLRAALGQLVATGLVSVRHGSGYLVRDYVESGGPDLLGPLLEVVADPAHRLEAIADVLHLRRALARAALERIVQRATPDTTKRVQTAVEAFAAASRAPGATPESLAAADRATIRALLRETGSTVLQLAANPVFRVADALPDLDRAMFADPGAILGALEALVFVVETRNVDAIDRLIDLLVAADALALQRLASGASSPARPKKPRTRKKSR